MLVEMALWRGWTRSSARPSASLCRIAPPCPPAKSQSSSSRSALFPATGDSLFAVRSSPQIRKKINQLYMVCSYFINSNNCLKIWIFRWSFRFKNVCRISLIVQYATSSKLAQNFISLIANIPNLENAHFIIFFSNFSLRPYRGPNDLLHGSVQIGLENLLPGELLLPVRGQPDLRQRTVAGECH